MIDLVLEFYSNIEIINGEIRTYVRGAHKDLHVDYIRALRQEVPQVENPTYPPRKNVAMNMVGAELMVVATFSWAGKRFFCQGELTDKYKMLNLIAVSNLAPIGRKNKILPEMTCLLYALGKGHNIDLPSLILNEMKKGCDMKRNSLPFGTLVTEMCKDHGIRVRLEMII